MKKNNNTDKAVINKIKQEIETMRPFIQEDGGDVSLVSFNEDSGVVTVQLQGHCVGCPLAEVTLKQGLEERIRAAVPSVREVVAVQADE